MLTSQSDLHDGVSPEQRLGSEALLCSVVDVGVPQPFGMLSRLGGNDRNFTQCCPHRMAKQGTHFISLSFPGWEIVLLTAGLREKNQFSRWWQLHQLPIMEAICLSGQNREKHFWARLAMLWAVTLKFVIEKHSVYRKGAEELELSSQTPLKNLTTYVRGHIKSPEDRGFYYYYYYY